jgi:hypothetical protein
LSRSSRLINCFAPKSRGSTQGVDRDALSIFTFSASSGVVLCPFALKLFNLFRPSSPSLSAGPCLRAAGSLRITRPVAFSGSADRARKCPALMRLTAPAKQSTNKLPPRTTSLRPALAPLRDEYRASRKHLTGMILKRSCPGTRPRADLT